VGVDTIAPNLFKAPRPKMELYADDASTTKKVRFNFMEQGSWPKCTSKGTVPREYKVSSKKLIKDVRAGICLEL
jgi:hypothetical protein